MYVWMNRIGWQAQAVPCENIGESQNHIKERVVIFVCKRMSAQMGVCTVEVKRENVFHINDYLHTRKMMTRGEHEHIKKFNMRILAAMKTRRANGEIGRV